MSSTNSGALSSRNMVALDPLPSVQTGGGAGVSLSLGLGRLSPLSLPGGGLSTSPVLGGPGGPLSSSMESGASQPGMFQPGLFQPGESVTSALDRGRADMHMIVSTIDDGGWAVYAVVNPAQGHGVGQGE